jgi:uncharacterized protein YqhQ
MKHVPLESITSTFAQPAIPTLPVNPDLWTPKAASIVSAGNIKPSNNMLANLLFMATKPLVGGQAVVEGVMMRSPKSFAVAVRKPDQTIVIRERQWLSFSEKLPFLKWPLLRGATMLVESMYNGLSALQFSAEQAIQDKTSPQPSPATGEGDSKKFDWAMMGTMAFSMLLGIAIFKAVPHIMAYILGEFFGHDGVSALPVTSVWFHLVDGSIKMTLFIGYILAIGMMKDVKRIFMYHGAEHKSVHVFEKDLELNVENAKIQSTAHPRCGTSLILLVIAVSIIVFAFILPFVPAITTNTMGQSAFLMLLKIPLMLPVAGIAYEFQRAASKNPNNFWIKLFITPGMLMQRLTTREPTDDQLEIALAALRKALWREKNTDDKTSETDHLQTYANFAQVKEALIL